MRTAFPIGTSQPVPPGEMPMDPPHMPGDPEPEMPRTPAPPELPSLVPPILVPAT